MFRASLDSAIKSAIIGIQFREPSLEIFEAIKEEEITTGLARMMFSERMDEWKETHSDEECEKEYVNFFAAIRHLEETMGIEQ